MWNILVLRSESGPAVGGERENICIAGIGKESSPTRWKSLH